MGHEICTNCSNCIENNRELFTALNDAEASGKIRPGSFLDYAIFLCRDCSQES